jgi:hypothetical protein
VEDAKKEFKKTKKISPIIIPPLAPVSLYSSSIFFPLGRDQTSIPLQLRFIILALAVDIFYNRPCTDSKFRIGLEWLRNAEVNSYKVYIYKGIKISKYQRIEIVYRSQMSEQRAQAFPIFLFAEFCISKFQFSFQYSESHFHADKAL